MQKLTPNMAVKRIVRSVAFYRDLFGFEVQMAVAEDKSIDTDVREGQSRL